MQFSDRLHKQAGSKLLPFRAPSPALMGPTATLDLDQVPHDVGTLRRPPSRAAAPLPEHEGLAHDARNLMTSLEFLASLMAEPGVLGEEHKHFAQDLTMLNRVLGSLVERMAGGQEAGARLPDHVDHGATPTFAREPLRPRGGAVSPRVAPDEWNDAGAMVKSCERLLAAIAGPGVRLQVSFERGLGPLAISGEELTRVLINLVRNASESMPGGGRVNIAIRKGQGASPWALLTVQDTGAGIPAHALGQVFHAGFTSKKAHRRWPAPSHHGLGLTIVRDLVESAGGSVRVSSALQKGTTFEIKLPCRRA